MYKTLRINKIHRNKLWLLSMFEDRNHERYANVAWVIGKWMKRKGMGTQEGSQIVCGQFVTKLARKLRLLSDEVLDGLRAMIFCRSLDATTLRELIRPDWRLIAEDLALGVRVERNLGRGFLKFESRKLSALKGLTLRNLAPSTKELLSKTLTSFSMLVLNRMICALLLKLGIGPLVLSVSSPNEPSSRLNSSNAFQMRNRLEKERLIIIEYLAKDEEKDVF
ncbi:hypothetical protein Tco_1005534 [Tanacetum coccineum]|uniref:Uncharacterized protein n=1 Tax=Tanacetum coccineum TaxID=301880 RepID=A0ABQ5FEZ4_9ASTR